MDRELRQKRMGIVGFGHLGSALAQCLLRCGFPEEHLLIARGRSEETAARIARAGLQQRACDATEVFAQSDLIFVATRPQDLPALRGMPFQEQGLVVSLLAGVPLELLREVFGGQVCRMVCSNPETFLQERAIAGMFPEDRLLGKLLRTLHTELVPLREEDDATAFITATCLTGALLLVRDEEERECAIQRLEQNNVVFRTLYEWAKYVLPDVAIGEQTDSYLRMMATKGGLTEIIVERLRAGNPLDEAMLSGLQRCGQIAGQLAAELR